MKQKNKLFVLLSAVILLLDIVYVLMNVRLEHASFESALVTDAEHMKSSYELAIEQQEQTMLAIATFIANEPTTTQLFYQGQQAIAAQRRGEPVTDAQINQYRQQLYQEVASAWSEVQKEFSARQLHYHIEPGDISFLRVHKREKFGDDLTAVRHTVVDTHQFKNSRSGFETGRVYSGIRGVVPVFLIGGDEFVLLISALSNQEECLQLAQRLLALVNEPIPYKEQQLQVSASIGIIFLPSGESGINSAKIILAEADNAMYQAKRAGKNTIFVHEIST